MCSGFKFLSFSCIDLATGFGRKSCVLSAFDPSHSCVLCNGDTKEHVSGVVAFFQMSVDAGKSFQGHPPQCVKQMGTSAEPCLRPSASWDFSSGCTKMASPRNVLCVLAWSCIRGAVAPDFPISLEPIRKKFLLSSICRTGLT